MAWYSDEEHEFRQDCKEKKSVAASAFKQRTHCGKGGCSLPSDNLTKKELKAMNGECVTYASVKRPMNWEEFKKLPDDLKKEYVDFMRDSFNVPDRYIAAMFNVHEVTLGKYFKMLGLCRTERSNGRQKWDQHGFDVWCGAILELPEVPVADTTEEVKAVNEPSTPVEAAEDPAVEELDEYIAHLKQGPCGHVERKRAVPDTGKMTFDGRIEEIIETLQMLLGGAEVTLDVAWTVVDDVKEE